METQPTPIVDDHKAFARALVALAREHGCSLLTAEFQLSSSQRFRERSDNWSRVNMSWAEGRHGAAERIRLCATATDNISEVSE